MEKKKTEKTKKSLLPLKLEIIQINIKSERKSIRRRNLMPRIII